MAKDFADISRLELADELNATSKRESVSKLMKAWESKNAKRALQGAGLSTMAVSLAACNVDGVDVDGVDGVVDTTSQNDGETQLNEDAGGPNNLGGAVGSSAMPVLLTSNRDFGEFSGVAYAGEVWSPGGNVRVDSLGDEDSITGTGTADVLTATISASVVTPVLQGIETINIAFIEANAASAQTIDFEDSNGFATLNVTRITNDQGAVVDNINDVLTNISVSNSGEAADTINFSFNRDVLDGANDVLALSLDDVQAASLAVDGEDGEGYETINLTVVDTVDLTDLQIDSTVRLTISGAGDLTVANLTLSEGHLATIDASASTGDMDINLGAANVVEARVSGSSGTDIDFTYRGSAGDDYIRVDNLSLSTAQSPGEDDDGHDTIDGGAGSNTLDFTVESDADLIHNDVTVSNIQFVHIDNEIGGGGAATLDGQQFGEVAGSADLTQVTVRNNITSAVQEVATFNIDELDAGVLVRVQHSSDVDNDGVAATVVNVHLADGTGTSDSQTVEIISGANTSETFDFTLDIEADDDNNEITADDEEVENVTIIDSDNEDNIVNLISVAEHTGTIALSGGRADDTFTITGVIVAETLNASAQASDVTVEVGTEDQTIIMGSGDDTIQFNAADDLDENDTIDGGAGTGDMIIATFTADADDDLTITGVETLRTAVDASLRVDVSNSDDITTVSLMSNAIAVTTNAVQAAMADTDILTLEADAISTVELFGNTADGGAVGEVFNGLTITAFETGSPAALTIRMNNIGDDAATVGVITLDADVTSLTIASANDDNTGATTFNEISAASITSLTITDAIADADAVAAIETVINLDDTTRLATVDASGAQGGVNLNIEALADNATINLVQSDDEGNDAADSVTISFIGDTGADGVTITGGGAAEIITLANGDMDDLVVNAGGAVAGTRNEIDASAITGDNIELNGGDGDDLITGSAVDGTEINGGNGFNILNGGAGNDIIIGGTGVDTVVAGAGNDVISTGAGNDVITGGAGADTMTGGAGADRFVQALGDSVASSAQTFVGAVIAVGDTITFGNGVDVITDFTAGAGGDTVDVDNAGDAVTAIGQNQLALTDNDLFFLSGAFTNGVFVIAADGAGADTLIIDVDNTNSGVSDVISTSTSMFVLQGVDSDDLVAGNFV
jgi:hypothetical protein